jgi:hypothetical protein
MTRLVQVRRLKETNAAGGTKDYWDNTQATDRSVIEHQDFLEYRNLDQENLMADYLADSYDQDPL